MNILLKFLLGPLFLSFIACTSSKSAPVKDAEKHLFLDNRIIENTVNVDLVVGEAVKHSANPLFGEDNNWEKRFDNFYGNIVYEADKNVYRCWYSPFIQDYSSQGMTLEQRTKKWKPGKPREMGVCYAESKDGIHWNKPDLGITEYEGNKHNNIIKRGPHGTGVFKDANEKDPSKKYKAITKGLKITSSADGIHWSDAVEIEGVGVAGDTHNNVLWSPTLKKYVGFTRTWSKDHVREVSRIESEDFIHWSKPELVLTALNKNLQPYSMPVFYYAGVYLGFVTIHVQSTDRVYTELAWSPDTKIWHRISPGTPIIKNSEKKLDYDYGCIFTCANPVFKENEIWIYYGGSDWLHSSWRNGFLCLAVLRPDGFAGYETVKKGQIGTIVTKALHVNSNSLELNADVKKKGQIKITLLDNKGKEISKPVVIKRSCENKRIKLCDQDIEGNYKLKFEFVNAKLYSFTL